MSLNADDASFLDDAVNAFHSHTSNSGAPSAFVNALRNGPQGSRHDITVDGVPTRITLGAHRPPDSRRERAAFAELFTAMKAAQTDGIQPELPPEISMVVWEYQGRELRVCAPGSAPTLRRARIRRRLSALSPLPFLGAITQPFAGSATAVGIAFAPVLPPVHHPDLPAIPIVREMRGDIARPALPYAPGSVTPAPAALPWTVRPSAPPVEATAKDTSPQPPPPFIDPTPTVTPPSTARLAPSPAPTPTPTGEEATDPALVPTGAPTEPPTVEASNDPTVMPEPSPTPTVSVTELLDPVVRPARGHGKHPKRHVRHHRHGHRHG
ncbi:hypothetical protein [Actinomadura luteofluorescens]|uniref:hypothetical protein n=1 Tax=Actinomadura luteofluorescens TaxID=46163 RepID=UPI003D90B210